MVLLTILLVTLSLGACSRGENVGEFVTGSGDVEAPTISLPIQILGLAVHRENVSAQIEQVERPYLDSVGMFSFREDDLLRATLQVSRFNRLARPNSNSFRRSVIGLLGAQNPQQITVGDKVVYSTSGNEQNIFVWFEDRGLFVLSVHQEFEFPRTLLRRAISLNIEL